jgi:hypothetical protein
MKIIAFIASLVIALLVPIASVVILLSVQPRAGGATGGILLAGMTAICMMPVFGGIQIANWIADPATPEGHRYFLRLVLVIAGIQLLAAIAIVVASVQAGWPLWAPLISIAVGAGLSVGCIFVAERLRRADARKPQPGAAESAATDAALISALTIKRKTRTIVASFFIALFAAAVLIGGLEVVLPHSHPIEATDILSRVITVVVFGFLATSFACIFSARPLALQMKQTFNGNVINQRTITRVVLKGKNDQLSEGQRPLAARYAALAAVYNPFMIAQFLLLYCAMVLLQFNQLLPGLDHHQSPVNLVLGIVFLIVGIVLMPLPFRQLGRVKRYAAEHRADAVSARHPEPTSADPAR